MIDWAIATLRSYPELAIFLSLAIGFAVGPRKVAGFSLGNVTATLLAAVIIGQIGITISPNVKAGFFSLFIFAIGYSLCRDPADVRQATSGGRQCGLANVR